MTGHIRQRSPGSWEIRYRAGSKTRTETLRGGKRDAQRRLRELLTLADHGRHPDDPDKLTVGRWLDRWLGYVKAEKAAQTHLNYKTVVETHIKLALGDVLLSRLTPARLQEFYSTIGASGLKASSIKQYCTILRIALARAVELRLLAVNPADGIRKRLPKPPAPAHHHHVLDRKQCATILAAAKGSEFYPPIMLALATGARRNEILALRWADVDLDGAELCIRESIVRLGGETSRKAPKNGEQRTVTLPPEAVAELRRLKREQAMQLLRLGVRQDAAIEVCRRGGDGRMMNPHTLTVAFARLAKRLGLTCHFHDLRHAHASELLRQGVPVHVAAARLGHKDGGALLLRTYAHATDDAARDAANKVGGLLGKL